jgi:hypothetical protein
MHKGLLFTILFSISLYGITDEQYDELFVNLSNQGIVIGEDISSDELYNLIENGEVYLKNGQLDKLKLHKEIKQFVSYKEKQYEQINEKIDKNPQSKTHKEIKEYFNDNNERIEKAQKEFSSSDEDGVFSKFVNYILELMKY